MIFSALLDYTTTIIFCRVTLNPFPNFPWFSHVCSAMYKSFGNTVEKGKVAHDERFLLFHSVFYSFEEPYAIFIKFYIVVCKLFEFRRV